MKDRQHVGKGRNVPDRTKVRRKGDISGQCGLHPGRSKEPGLTPKGEESEIRREVFPEPVILTASDFQMTERARIGRT